jgi:hypothetical protein
VAEAEAEGGQGTGYCGMWCLELRGERCLAGVARCLACTYDGSRCGALSKGLATQLAWYAGADISWPSVR